MMNPENYLILAALLFAIGAVGVLTRRNALVAFMCVELMLNACNLALVAGSHIHGGLDGQFVNRRNGRGRTVKRTLRNPREVVRRIRVLARLRHRLEEAGAPHHRPADGRRRGVPGAGADGLVQRQAVRRQVRPRRLDAGRRVLEAVRRRAGPRRLQDVSAPAIANPDRLLPPQHHPARAPPARRRSSPPGPRPARCRRRRAP